MPDHTDSLSFKVGDILTDYSNVAVEVRVIASGGFGLVALGPDRLREGRWIALKMLRPDVLRRNPEAVPPTIENQRIFWLGWDGAYYRFGMYTEALTRNDRAYALAPQHPMVLAHRGDILKGLGRTEEALQMYAASLAARTPEDHQGRNIVLHQRGVLLKQSQRHAEAEASYEAALLEMPTAADTWYARAINAFDWGRQELQKGNASEAQRLGQLGLTCLQRAQEMKYDNPQMASLMADLRRLAGQG